MKNERILRWWEIAMAVAIPFTLAAIVWMIWRANQSPPATQREQRTEASAAVGKDHQRAEETVASAKAKMELAAKLEAAGDLGAAEINLRDALGTFEKLMGAEHLDTLRLTRSLAMLLGKKGNSREGETLLRRVSDGFERTLGPDHPDTLSSLMDLAVVLRKRGDNAGAEQAFRKVASTRERTLGPEDPATLNAMHDLAETLRLKPDWRAAEPIFRKTLEAKERVLGADHADTIETVFSLARVLPQKEREPLLRRSLEGRSRILGTEHPETLLNVDLLAMAVEATGRWKEAAELYHRAFEARERTQGPGHPDTLYSLYYLTWFLRRQRAYGEFEPLHHRLVEDSMKYLGIHHPETIRRIRDYGGYLLQRGDGTAGESFLRQALNNYENTGDAGNFYVNLMRNDLAKICAGNGMNEKAEKLFRRTLELQATQHANQEIMRFRTAFHFAVTLQKHLPGAEVIELLRYANEGLSKSMYGTKDADATSARVLLQELGADVRGGNR